MQSLLGPEVPGLLTSHFGVAAEYASLVGPNLDLLYAPPLRHVTSCCINRFQSASRIDMPCWVESAKFRGETLKRSALLGTLCT